MQFAMALLLLCLGLLLVQDWKYRKIHIGLPVAVFGLSVYIAKPAVTAIFFNAAFFLTVLGLLVLYMSIKNKQFSNPFLNYFGLGDLLYFLCITPLFLLREYVLFFILSMVFAIGLQLALRRIMKHETVPLAGFSALLLMVMIAKDQLTDFQKMTLL